MGRDAAGWHPGSFLNGLKASRYFLASLVDNTIAKCFLCTIIVYRCADSKIFSLFHIARMKCNRVVYYHNHCTDNLSLLMSAWYKSLCCFEKVQKTCRLFVLETINFYNFAALWECRRKMRIELSLAENMFP